MNDRQPSTAKSCVENWIDQTPDTAQHSLISIRVNSTDARVMGGLSQPTFLLSPLAVRLGDSHHWGTLSGADRFCLNPVTHCVFIFFGDLGSWVHKVVEFWRHPARCYDSTNGFQFVALLLV